MPSKAASVRCINQHTDNKDRNWIIYGLPTRHTLSSKLPGTLLLSSSSKGSINSFLDSPLFAQQQHYPERNNTDDAISECTALSEPVKPLFISYPNGTVLQVLKQNQSTSSSMEMEMEIDMLCTTKQSSLLSEMDKQCIKPLVK